MANFANLIAEVGYGGEAVLELELGFLLDDVRGELLPQAFGFLEVVLDRLEP